jgi:hypothetical protein
MSLMKMVAGSEGKSQVAFSTPAAASVTVASNELALWVLPTKSHQQVEITAVVYDMLERLREVGTPTPTTVDAFTTAIADTSSEPVFKKDVVLAFNEAFAIPTDDTIQIYIGELFQPTVGSSITTAVKRLYETWLEQVGKLL